MDNSSKETLASNSTNQETELAGNCETVEEGGKDAEEDDTEGTEDDEGDDELLEKELLGMEGEEEDEDDAGDELTGDEENDAPNDGNSGEKKRKNIRKMMNDDELAEETRLEQEREMERIRWLREMHEKSLAEEREKKKVLHEERKKQKSGDSSKPVILLVDDSDGEPDHKKPKKEPTVITLSSDESEPESDKPLTGYDDTTAFVGGMHTDDAKNVPDSQGRVLINVNHPPDESDVFLTPKLAKSVKPHQIGGIRFLYDNIIESVSRFNSSPGFGCILAHTMGLGKTLQTISFVDSCLRNTPSQCVLIVVPVNVLQNWVNEFEMWVPEHFPEEHSKRSYPIYVINDLLKTFQARATLIKKWSETGGVMILGYEMFRLLALTEPTYAVSRKLCRKRRKRGAPVKEVCDIDEEEYYMDLLTATQRSLLCPGPGLVVCDEGHRIKNAHATISKALKKIRTRRRIVLTGYPLQNNLEEYWCMVDFVRPNFLGTKNEFNNMFVRPIENGQCVDSTFKDTQLMKFRSHVLHSLLEGFVQRRDQSILQHTLQSKTEYVLCVKMTPVQRRLLKRFAADMEIDGAVNPIYAFTVLTKIWNHPDVLQEVVASRGCSKIDDLDVDLPKASTKLSLEWAQDELVGMRRGVVEDGAKMVLLLELIEESVAIGDKVVVFSQSLLTLSLVEKFLQQRYVPEGCSSTKNDIRSYFNGDANSTSVQGPDSPEYPAPNKPQLKWTKNKHYFRLDGSTNGQDRERLIKQFNKKGESALVFLISTRAGSLGVNLIGSNRVIIMDVSWNPCHDAQAVCRIYRYGQTKPSYVYRFVAENTLERTIYNKQITKQGMSSRVIDEQNVDKQFTSAEIVSSSDNFEMLPPAQPNADLWKHMIPNIGDNVLRTVVERHFDLLTAAPFTHESLLIENKNERLTQEEKMLAKKSYQFEKQMNKGFGGFSNTYSKPVNRVTPMCKAAPKPGSGPPCQPVPPLDTTAHWNKTPPVTGVPLEEFAEKYNATNWSPLIKPLSPLQNDDTGPILSFQNIPISPQEHLAARQQTQQTYHSRVVNSGNNATNIAPKPRSILPAPPTNPQQPFLMSSSQATPVQAPPPLKLPLPRLTSHQSPLPPSNPAKRNRKPSKVVSSVRPTQAIIAPGEDGKCTYKVPIPRAPDTPPSSSRDSSSSTPTSNSGKSSITDALRAIDERVIEPPTVSVQRMIEENELLRRQIELDGYFAFSKSSMPGPLLQASTPQKLSPAGQSSASTTPVTTPGLPREEDCKAQSDLNSTNESKEDEKIDKQCKPKKKSSKKSTSQTVQQQVVYQAIPAQAVQSNQGYQLLIQMPPGGTLPSQTKMVPATQIIQAQPGQQFINSHGAQVINGQPIFIQKQPAPLQLQMPAGSKAVYLVSQPSNISSQAGQMNQTATTTVQSFNTINSTSMDQYIMAPAAVQDPGNDSKEVTPESTPSSTTSTPQHDVVQQTPPPTLLSPVNYDIQPQLQSSPQLQPQPVLIQQQPSYQQFQFQQPQYQTYFAGTQMIQPRIMPQQMYMQPSQIQRVQQRPKLKPKPKTAPAKAKPKKPKPPEAVDNQMTQAQMHANILAQQKQRQLTQQMHHQTLSAAYNQRPQLSYPPQQQYYTPVTGQGMSQSSMVSEPSNCQVAGSQDNKITQRFYNPGYPAQMYHQHVQYGQYMPTQQHIQQLFSKEDDKRNVTPNKRKSRKKTSDEQCDNRVNIQIHSPISFPAEKKQKKTKKLPDCPYSQQSTPTPAAAPVHRDPHHMNYAQLHHQQHLYQNMMQMYRQQAPHQQQQQQQQHPPTSIHPHQGYQQLPTHHHHYQHPSPQPPPLLYKQYLQKQQPVLQKPVPPPAEHSPLRGATPQYWGSPQYHQYPSDQRYGYVGDDMNDDEDDRTSSPQSEGEMDVNQFLNIPIKSEPRETTGS